MDYIKNIPKICHLHLHFNTILYHNNFKKYLEKNNIDIKIPNLTDAKSWKQLKYNQKKLRPLFKNDKIFQYIIDYYLEKSLENNICYTEFRGILGLFTNYSSVCKIKSDKYALDVYYRVLIMFKTLYLWKLKYITQKSHPEHYNKLSLFLKNINFNIIQLQKKNCQNKLKKNIYSAIISKKEVIKSEEKIQMVLLMDFKFIIAHPKELISQFEEYLMTCRIVNKLLNFKFIIAFDLYSEEDKVQELRNYDNFITKILNKYPEFLFICHAGETFDKNKGIENINYLLEKGCKRIGHAFYLLNGDIKNTDKIFIETCPYSNKILKFYPKVENHPAKDHIHSKKIIVSISSDDPGLFGYDNISKDWLLIYKKWNLDTKDIKKLIFNGLETAKDYGGMSEEYQEICKKIVKKYFK